MKLSKAIEGFILAKSADGLSPNTLSIYHWALAKLVTFVNDPELADLTTEDLRRWFVWLRDEYKPQGLKKSEHLSIASIQDAWRALKSFYTWAVRDLGIPRVDDIRRPSGESAPIIPLNEEEVRALLKAAEKTQYERSGKAVTVRRPQGLRNVAILLVLLDTGMRVGELTRLSVSDVNVASGEIVIRPFGTGKKTAGRMVYLGKASRRAVWRYLADREVEPGDLMFTTDSGRPLRTGVVLQLLIQIGKAAKVTHVHPHRLRHTFAIQFLRAAGGNIFVLQKLLGHKSLEMVKRYLHIVNSDAQAAMQTASPADRWKL